MHTAVLFTLDCINFAVCPRLQSVVHAGTIVWFLGLMDELLYVPEAVYHNVFV